MVVAAFSSTPWRKYESVEGRGKRSKHSFPPRSRENSPWPDLTRVKCEPKCPRSRVNRSSERISPSPLETGREITSLPGLSGKIKFRSWEFKGRIKIQRASIYIAKNIDNSLKRSNYLSIRLNSALKVTRFDPSISSWIKVLERKEDNRLRDELFGERWGQRSSFPRPITDFHARLSPEIGGQWPASWCTGPRQLERQRAENRADADSSLIFYEFSISISRWIYSVSKTFN